MVTAAQANAMSHLVSALTPLLVALGAIIGVTILSATGHMESQSAVAVYTAVLGYAAGHRSGVRTSDTLGKQDRRSEDP